MDDSLRETLGRWHPQYWKKESNHRDKWGERTIDSVRGDSDMTQDETRGGFWTAVDNFCGYVLGYDPHIGDDTSEDGEEQEEWREVMM